MKKLLYISILVASTSMQAYKLTFSNETKETAKVLIDYHVAPFGFCSNPDRMTLAPGQSDHVEVGACCTSYFSVTTEEGGFDVSFYDRHPDMCETKKFHIVYDNKDAAANAKKEPKKVGSYTVNVMTPEYTKAKKIRVDWNKFGE